MNLHGNEKEQDMETELGEGEVSNECETCSFL